ncbi:variant erythrocyte surface antigen-1 family protein [Babesia caballi]|uniref:Variant erythrocyte surface antigen-1 family protein n=1 Tax=Babesia caballi TaxID=5871 RepID=A0AAV4LP41_BABCB|nr:variant erythrocyte surface antigen-1 family protein [Babesia caballi]
MAAQKQLTDCPANLKEAIDWIPGVTGKDGGGGSAGNETILAKATTKLPDFRDAIEAASKNPEGGSGDASKALKNLKSENTLGSIIENLTDGLRAFVGYGGQGQGIANVIDPLQQLRKGVLLFLYSFLSSVKTLNVENHDAIEAVGKARMGKETFESAMQQVSQISQGDSSINSIPDVVSALKQVNGLISQKDAHTFPEAVSTYLTGVLEAVVKDGKNQAQAEVNNLKTKLSALITTYENHGDILSPTNEVKETNETLDSNKGRSYPFRPLLEGVIRGTENMLIPLKKTDGYKSAYLGQSWDYNINDDKFAQIFLGSLPLYYYWLTYLYWKCKQPREDGGWDTLPINRPGIKEFIVGHGYNAMLLNTRTKGEQIVTAFSNFKTEFSSVTTHKSHTEFFASLDPWSKSVSDASTHPLTTLFLGASIYFTSQQSKRNATSNPRSPTSIREMLYWLSGLQFSPHYSDLTKHIDNVIPAQHGLPVADSSTSSPDNVITQSQMKGFLLSSCLSAPGVLGAIQGDAADSKEPDGEPWLYSLFSNNMNLRYPSGPALFNTLASYSYALQFQLYFLYRQCQNNYSYTCGWKQCAFGKNVNARIQGSIVVSYICPTGCTKGSHDHSTRPDQCEHTGCGESTKGSPLQAFLTDNLKGFCRQHPGTSTHLTECSLGSVCHLPMGFRSTQLKSSGLGEQIFYPLLFSVAVPALLSVSFARNFHVSPSAHLGAWETCSASYGI